MGNTHQKSKKWRWVFVISLVILAGSAAAAAWRVERFISAIHSENDLASSNHNTKVYNHQPLSLILLGKDARGNFGGDLTDTMILITLNPQQKKITMLSIPRDTRVIIPGEDKARKINSVFKHGEQLKQEALRQKEKPEEDGPSMVKKTLESVYGIPIDHYIMINFTGFEKLIDELGGVKINVDRRMVYHDPTDGTSIDLQPGWQILNGEKALEFVRYRHDDRGIQFYSTDFERNARQQKVIKAALTQMKSFDGFTHLFQVLDTAGENIKTDLSTNEIKGIMGDFQGFNPSQIVSLSDRGSYWDTSSHYVIMPKKMLDHDRMVLQRGLGLSSETQREYNDSPAGIDIIE